MKKVSFKDDEKEESREVKEIISALEMRQELRGWKDELERKITSLKGRILVIEKFMIEQRDEERRRLETLERWERESTTSVGSR